LTCPVVYIMYSTADRMYDVCVPSAHITTCEDIIQWLDHLISRTRACPFKLHCWMRKLSRCTAALCPVRAVMVSHLCCMSNRSNRYCGQACTQPLIGSCDLNPYIRTMLVIAFDTCHAAQQASVNHLNVCVGDTISAAMCRLSVSNNPVTFRG
jgi:hypothetical protein